MRLILNKAKIRKGLKIFLILLCCLTLGIGVYWTIAMLIPLGGLSNTFAFGIAQLSGFLLFLYLLSTLLLLKLVPRTRKKTEKLTRNDDISKATIKIKKNNIRKVIGILGLSLIIFNSLPLISTPYAIETAEKEFEGAFGANWRDQIPDDIESFFMPSQFNLANYFLGIPQKDCNIDTDIQYYSEGDDFYLTFDVYYPKATHRELPGHNSTIIKIHGGGWTEGDKSQENMLWVNRYLAAQGYIVFDIQYGLMDTEKSTTLPTPEHVRGDFTLHDMIYQIGYFTKQLEDKLADRYQARLDSVFIMGNSAGGHLTGVVGLGYNDPYFAGNYSNALTIKGIVPLYPPNDAKRYFSSGDLSKLLPDATSLEFEKFTPSELVDENDPPAIIFQGLNDGLVDPKNSEEIEEALEVNYIACVLLMFPFAAHANDFMANNNYSQVWLYYLERFLYLTQ